MPRINHQSFFVVAHNIRSLYNIGSIFRTADAFGITKIYLTGYSGTPANPVTKKKISKVALGAEEFVQWEYKKSAVRLITDLRFKIKDIHIVGLEQNQKSQNLNKFKPKFPLVLVLGEEVNGIHKSILKLCDQIVEIPMLGKKESLNVSVAFGVAAYKIRF